MAGVSVSLQKGEEHVLTTKVTKTRKTRRRRLTAEPAEVAEKTRDRACVAGCDVRRAVATQTDRAHHVCDCDGSFHVATAGSAGRPVAWLGRYFSVPLCLCGLSFCRSQRDNEGCMQRTLVATLAVFSLIAPTFAQQRAPQNESIRQEDLRADLFFLAGDSLRGRLTDTEENRAAADFIRSRFERMG